MGNASDDDGKDENLVGDVNMPNLSTSNVHAIGSCDTAVQTMEAVQFFIGENKDAVKGLEDSLSNQGEIITAKSADACVSNVDVSPTGVDIEQFEAYLHNFMSN